MALPEKTCMTAEAAAFADSVRYEAIPEDALKIGRRCMIDGIGIDPNYDVLQEFRIE